MGLKFKKTLQVPGFLTDVRGKLTLPMFINFALEVSGEQLDAVGEEAKLDDNLNWVIIKYDIDIHRMPKAGELIEIETEPESFNKVFYYRHFIARDQDGIEIAKVKGAFTLMDLDKRKMVSIPKELGYQFDSKYIKTMKRGKAIEHFEPSLEPQSKYQVRYFDIDENRHVNNSKYFEWVLDALPAQFLYDHEVRSMAIKFNKEIYADEEVNSYVKLIEEDGQIKSLHKIRTGDKDDCQAEVHWKKI